MAAIVRYYAEFKDRKGKNIRVEFCDNEFTGVESEVKLGANAFSLNWAGDANTPHQAIITSSAKFFLIVESTGVYDWLLELPNAAENRFTVAIKTYASGSYGLRWAGVLMVDGVEIEDIFLPQRVTLEANDDLARLQDVLYKSSETVEFTGIAYIHEHIRNCILKLRTAHHWENSETLLRMVPYLRPSADTDDGFQLTQIKHNFFHNANEEGEKQYLSVWQVLEEIALLYGARIFLDFGAFWFQPISAFTRDTLRQKLLGVEFYTKGGTIYTGIDITSYNDFDTDIERIRGWSTSFLPRIKRVEREYNSGDTLALGYNTQWPYSSTFGDNGDELVENLTGSVNAVYLVTPLGGYTFVQAGMLPRFRFLFVCNTNAITGLTGNNKAVRWRFELYIKVESLSGGTDYYINRNVTHSSTNTSPLLLADSSIVEVSGVDYSAATWGTNTANRATFISTPVDGTQAHTISENLEINLPEVNEIGVVQIAVAAHAIDADGNDLTTAHSFVVAQYAQGNTLYPAHGEAQGADKYLYYAEAEDGREVIKLPPAIIGDRTSETTHCYTEFNSIPTIFWEHIDETATEPVHQHVVREILAYRAKAMLIRSGSCRPISTNNSAGMLSMGYSLTKGTDIYVCLGMEWQGARAEYDIQIGLIDRNTTLIDSEDGHVPVLGAPPPDNGGPVVITSTPITLSTEAQETSNNIIATVLRQSMRQAERTKLGYITNSAAVNLDTAITVINRIVGDYTADAGSLKAITPIGATTPPRIDIYKANDDTITQATVKVTIAVSTALGSSYTFTLPKALPTTGSELLSIGNSGTVKKVADGSSGEFLTTNGAGVLSWAAASGGSSSDGWHGSTTLLKVMPSEFMANDDAPSRDGYKGLYIEDDTINYLGVRIHHTSTEMYVQKAIPTGYKATHVHVYASASTSSAVIVHSFNHTTGAISSEGSGDFNSSIDITDITSAATTNINIKLLPASTSTTIYGADITLAAV